MPLTKQLREIRASDGLSQKYDPRALPGDKSASAVNLVKNKQGRLEKRRGLWQLLTADPFGSNYTATTGLGLGTWNNGSGDNLLIIGRGNRPNTTALATSLQAYSDDLNGPVLRGQMPELRVVSDSPVAGAAGAVTNPVCALNEDFVMSAWIESSTPLSALPQPPVGFVTWQVTQVSTGQVIVGPALVDTTSTGSGVQYVRVDAVGNSFVIAYSRAGDPNIYARTMALTSLVAGGTWSPSPPNAPTAIVTNNVSHFAAFTMRSSGDGTNFVVAYESGTGNPDSRGTTPIGIIVQSFVATTRTLVNTWTVQSASSIATAYGIRVNTATNHVVVAYAMADAGGIYSYQILSAVGSYPALTQVNTPTIIYTPTTNIASGAPESPPFFLDVSLCPGTAQGNENYVATHSPGGSVWNAANLPATAAKAGGTGATATCGLKGTLGSVTSPPPTPGNYFTLNNVFMNVTDAQGNSGGSWAASNTGGDHGLYFAGASTNYGPCIGIDQAHDTLISGTSASISFSAGVVTVTGMSSLTSNYQGDTITISNSTTPGNNGTFSLNYISATSCSFTNPNGANDASGSVHWQTPASDLIYPLTASFSGGGAGSTQAATTAIINGGIYAGGFTIEGGSGYVGSPLPTATFTPVDGNGSGAAATVGVSGGQVTGLVPTASGSGYTKPPTITIAYPTTTVSAMQQSTQCRLIGFTSSDNLHTENNARILNNMFFVNTTLGGAVNRYNPTDGFGYCCGDGTGPGASYASHALSCVTPGLTLASSGLEANGIVYYLGWVPSQTEGSFIVLAFDLAQNPIVSGGPGITGNGWPMRPVASLQTRTALSDPGGGLQAAQSGQTAITGSPTIGPNMWTGGSYWALNSDAYSTAYVSYVSSSMGERLSLVTGAIQTLPRLPPQMAQWGNLTGISGAIPTVFDGHSVFEQGFLWSPGSIVAVAVTTAGPLGAGIDFSSAQDVYSWIFTWEHFDDGGGLHQSARSRPVTITGQNLIDAGLVTGPQLAAGVSFSFTFIVPALGATMRMFPEGGSGALVPQLGNDLRAFCAQPTSSPSLGIYRTQKNEPVYYRVYDRAFNGTDSGGASFTLPALVNNNFISSFPNTGNPGDNLVGVVKVTDGLNDTVITRVNAEGILPFPLLYGDGTGGLPGNADQFCPPASDVMVAHKGRLFVSRGNQLLHSKVSASGTAPGFNEVLFSVDAGADDDITWGASMDDRFVIGKSTSNYYITGNGPADDGSGDSYGQAQPIPTDLGCTSPRSAISTPEGVYYQSNAGLRLLDRGLNLRYVGGPVSDELNTYPIALGAVLYPQNNRMILLASTSDVPNQVTHQVLGEFLMRDYSLDAWTTGVVMNGGTQVGFVSAAVAVGQGPLNTQTFTRPPSKPTLHLLGADGVVWREHDPVDQKPYYDGSQYVSWSWTSPPVLPTDERGEVLVSGRFRCWDIILTAESQNPHGLIIGVGIDGGSISNNRTWVWNNGTQQGSIAPGGVIPTPLTKLRTYDGRLGSQFQVQVQDVSDPNSTTGEGADLIGLTFSLGTYPGPYKLPASQSQ